MNSKKKNKNRQNKPPNPTPPQKKEEVIESVSPPEEKIESVIEERVPNIVSEKVPVEVKLCEETPKKPKRNRGKKKKEDEKSDKEDDIKVEDPVLVPETQIVKDELDDSTIAPTARKKKNKNKKYQEAVLVEKAPKTEVEGEIKVKESEIKVTDDQKTEEAETEFKSTKKKNKRKKNRNDSEKSEKEGVSCTSAFQKLLVEDERSCNKKTENSAQPAPNASYFSEVVVKAVEVPSPIHDSPDVKSQEETVQKVESNKNKKEHKQDMRNPPVVVVDPAEAIEAGHMTKIKEMTMRNDIVEKSTETLKPNTEIVKVEEVIPSTSTTDEKNTIIKAQIVKPVDKKKKGKKYAEKTYDKKLEDVKASEVDPLPKEVSAESETLPIVTYEDPVLQEQISLNWHEEVKLNEGNGPLIGCEDKSEVTALVSENHTQNKKGTTSPKPPRRNETEVYPEVPTEITIGRPELDESKILEVSGSSTQQAGPLTEELRLASPVTTPVKVDSQEEKQECVVVPAETEKRQKGKKSPKPQRRQDVFGSEILTGVTEPDIVTDSKATSSSTEKIELKTEESTDIKPEVKTEQLPEIRTDILVESQEAIKDEKEHINKSENEKKEKRKKSPKPSVDTDIISGSKNIQFQDKANKNVFNIDDLIIVQAEVVSHDKVQFDKPLIAAEEDKTEKNDDNQKIEVKSDNEKSKKRKKSPKPPQIEAAIESKSPSRNIDGKETQTEVSIPVTPKVRDIKLSPDTVPGELEMPRIELISSPSDITPDFIEYPRCSSEHPLDTNNNTVIQEILPDESKLDVRIVIPETTFIRSTDLITPELTTSGIHLTNVEKQNPAEDNTDLKFKVMDVNQDMEELRLSIEKSLAELTSLEKTDEEVEKQMEDQGKLNFKKPEIDETMPDLPMKEQPINPLISVKDSVENIKEPASEEMVCHEPICPERKDRKGKGKSKKKGKQEIAQSSTQQSTPTALEPTESTQSQDTKKDSNKSEQKSDNTQEKGKQQPDKNESKDDETDIQINEEYKPDSYETILNFEDAMTSSVDDVNQSFEIIANEANPSFNVSQNNPEINIIAPQEDDKDIKQGKQNPVSPPKNLLGHPDIPVPSNKTDYKKERNKTPNYRQAKVKIKDSDQVEIEPPEKIKQSKESQTENKRKLSEYQKADESICVTNKSEDYVYKYSFRKVFLQCACHVCKKDLAHTRVPCNNCNLIFYCNQKHKDEDYAQHQALCFAVSTIVHLKDQKFIYADAQNITGHNYRLLRMQMIVSCEKVLKRRLAPWEQETLLYPRICADAGCREWRQGQLRDCEGCGQISYCSVHPDHLPKLHARWCKSYNLYRALVRHQQTKGRLEPKLPTRVVNLNPLPDNINEVLANMYEERIDMSDIEYAALTQLATAPLTALYCLQSYNIINKINGVTKKSTLTLHIVGAELQFEADVLNKWEVFLLHLLPEVKELRVVLVGPDLNPSNLPLDLLGKIKTCENCQQNKRRVLFSFQDKRTFHEFWGSDDFTTPDLVCAFNPNIQRSSTYIGKDTWPSTINCILKLKAPFAITSYTLSELNSDLHRIQECAGVGFSVVCTPKTNSFASVRPDRNFISDDEAPLLFKNHCVTVVCGV